MLFAVFAVAIGSAEAHAETTMAVQSTGILGSWKVLSLRGVRDLSVGDMVEFTDDGRCVTHFHKPLEGKMKMLQEYRISGRKLEIRSGNLDVDYRIVGDRLVLSTPDGFVDVVLRRAGRVIVG